LIKTTTETFTLSWRNCEMLPR